MGQGCLERFDFHFYKYVWNYHKNQGERFNEHAKNFFSGELTTLKTEAQIKQYLDTISFYP